MSDILDEIVGAINQRNDAQLVLQQQLDAAKSEVAHITALLSESNDKLQAANAKIVELQGKLSPSGVAVPTSDLPGWKLLFTDDFAEDVPLGSFPAAVASKWQAYPYPWKDTSKNGTYDPDRTVKVQGSILTQTLHTPADGAPRVSAILPLIHGPNPANWPQPQNSTRDDQLYGRYSVRMRIPKPIPGYKIAWLLWPDFGTNTTGANNGVGGNGEIDWPETNLDTLSSVSGFVHRQNATVRSDQYAANLNGIDMAQWHTYTIEWSPNLVRFLYDGSEIGKTTERVPNTMMHWVIQSETKISSTKPAATVSGDIEIDWVAVWAYQP